MAVFGAILYFFLSQPGCLYSMVYRFMLGMLAIPVSTRVLTALSVSFACKRLEETETSHYSCRFLSSVNLRGTYSANTLWNCDMSTVIAAQCHRIHHSQMPYAAVSFVALSVCSLTRASLRVLIENFRHALLYRQIHRSCHIRTCDTPWQTVDSTSHYYPTLPGTVEGHRLPKTSLNTFYL